MVNKEIMTDEDDFYWELLEEQHAHDVVISGAVDTSEEEENH